MPPRHPRVSSPKLVGRFSPHRYLVIGECQAHPIERPRNAHNPRIHPTLRLELFTTSAPSMHELPRRVTGRPRPFGRNSLRENSRSGTHPTTEEQATVSGAEDSCAGRATGRCGSRNMEQAETNFHGSKCNLFEIEPVVREMIERRRASRRPRIAR
jgi:hypothetical protein